MGWAVAIFAFAVLILIVVEGAAVLGFFGALMNERVERCHRCGQIGLTSNHAMHPDGCPQHVAARMLHAWAAHPHHFHPTHLSH